MSPVVEAVVCLQAQDIDDDDGGVGRVRGVHGPSNNVKGVGRGQRNDKASKGLEKTAEAAKIRGQQRRLWRCDGRPEELATTREASSEKDKPKDSTITIEASTEEAEDTMRLGEHLQWRRRRCFYSLMVLTTTTVALVEEDGPKNSARTTEASVGGSNRRRV